MSHTCVKCNASLRAYEEELDEEVTSAGKVMFKTFCNIETTLSYLNDPSNEVVSIISMVTKPSSPQIDTTYTISDKIRLAIKVRFY